MRFSMSASISGEISSPGDRVPAGQMVMVAAIIAEVPSYDDALTGSMGENIRNAVQLALGGFLSLAGGRRGADPRTPTAPSVEGAYQLGRGEAARAPIAHGPAGETVALRSPPTSGTSGSAGLHAGAAGVGRGTAF